MSSPSERERIARLWQAVFVPAADVVPVELPPWVPGADAFSKDHALSLAWLCHAVYLPEAEERRASLHTVGFEEIDAHDDHWLHWSLVGPRSAPDDLIVAFRGTSDLRHWLFNVNTLLTACPKGGKVHGGFLRAYQKVASSLSDALRRASAPDRRLTLCGHSLGGALALLAGTEHPAASLYTFGCPRPGNPAFAECFEETPVYRVIHDQDVVTTVPYEFQFLHHLAYKHVGIPVQVRPDQPVSMGPECSQTLPHSLASWKQTLHAVLEGDHRGEPPPVLLDHAPSGYVRALREIVS